ncbi:CD209 antigen-like [Chelmon rostratus]|uniref:CD209 antigen-like n=1 Tax=Chelmon rostratus TaxID=109905 RepID=UPI001BE611D6|nr:CD209 antigen-like [Chelmon rostratus]
MDEIYVNVKHDKSAKPRASANQTGPRSSGRRFHGAVVLFLGLLNVFLLAGLIGLGVHYYDSVQHSAAELSAMRADLTERLQASDGEFSSLTEERDLLNASLVKITQELNRLSPCPAGWTKFRCACYLLSNESGSWETGREDCSARGADLVVVDSTEEQRFLSNFTAEGTLAWIGLTDRVKEGTWTWIDGAPLTLK